MVDDGTPERGVYGGGGDLIFPQIRRDAGVQRGSDEGLGLWCFFFFSTPGHFNVETKRRPGLKKERVRVTFSSPNY